MSHEGTNIYMSKMDGRKRRADISTMSPDDTVDDEVELHHLGGHLPSRKRHTATNHDGGIEFSSHTTSRTNTALKPPPPLQRTKQQHSIANRVGGFDPVSLAWLQRMEEIATIWLNMLVQQQHLYRQYQDSLSNEKQRIVDFCSRSLQQILSEGGFRSYTTPLYPPALYSQPLPPLQDLPCMVVTLKYWYSTLLSRCQHQTAVGMLPHRVLTPQQMAHISVKEYVHACENEVKRWLKNVAETDPKSNKTDGIRSDENQANQNQAHVAVWTQQLQNKSVLTYSPVRPKSTAIPTNQATSKPCNNKGGSRLPSPTDVMMFDSGVAPVSALEDCNKDEYEDSKPAAKNPPNASTNISIVGQAPLRRQYQQQSPNISLEKANRMRGLILSLYHANKCPFSDATDADDRRCCPVSTGCGTVKDLWHHITTNPDRSCCLQNTCSYSRLALCAEEALKHFGHCKKETCFICGPVLAHMPKVKRDISIAIEASRRQAAAIEQAILQVVDDITAEADSGSLEANEEYDVSEISKHVTTPSSSGMAITNIKKALK